MVMKPKFKIRGTVQAAKEDLPSKKGYKQSLTEEELTIIKIAAFNPLTCSLVDAKSERVLRKFYEPELVNVSKNGQNRC